LAEEIKAGSRIYISFLPFPNGEFSEDACDDAAWSSSFPLKHLAFVGALQHGVTLDILLL